MSRDDDDDDDWTALLDDDDDVNTVDKTTLVDRLAPAFAAHHRQGKEHVKHAFIPVLQHTKHLHDAIHDDIFPRRAHGLALLDQSTLRFEDAARRDADTTRTVYEDTKHSLDALFTSLSDLVRQSDMLFQTFKASMHEHAQQLHRCVDRMPNDAERLIAALDKKGKHLGADDHARAKENLLRGILEKY